MTKRNKIKKYKKTKRKNKNKKTMKRYKRGGQNIVREDTDPPAYKESYDELVNK